MTFERPEERCEETWHVKRACLHCVLPELENARAEITSLRAQLEGGGEGEWRIDECPGEAPAWRMKDWWVQGDGDGAWECYIDNDEISLSHRGLTFAAAKSLASLLSAILDSTQ